MTSSGFVAQVACTDSAHWQRQHRANYGALLVIFGDRRKAESYFIRVRSSGAAETGDTDETPTATTTTPALTTGTSTCILRPTGPGTATRRKELFMASRKIGMILIVVAIVLFLGGGTVVAMGIERFSAASESEKLSDYHMQRGKAAGAAGDVTEEAATAMEWAADAAAEANRQRGEGYTWGGLGAVVVLGSVALLVVGLRQRRKSGAATQAA